MAQYDAIVIGANNAGLICAAFLKRNGLKTLLIEREDHPGATAITTEVEGMPAGYRFNLAATGQGWVNPMVVEKLELEKYGFENFGLNPSLTTTFGDGNYLSIWVEADKTIEEIRKFSEHDAEAYKDFLHKWQPFGVMMKQSMLQDAPGFAQMAGAMTSSVDGKIAFRDIFFKGMKTLVYQTFENDYVRRAFIPLLEGSSEYPDNTTPLFMIAHLMTQFGAIKHGYAGLIDAFNKAAVDQGVEFMYNTTVKRIIVEGNKATGVELTDGTVITADKVISNLEVNNTMLNLVGEDNIEDKKYAHQVKDIRYKAQGITLSMAIDTMPDFGFPEDRFGGWFGFGPDYKQVETAYYQYNMGRIPDDLQIIGYMPSYWDDFYAPEGGQCMQFFVFPVPYDLEDSSWDDPAKKQELYDKFEKKILEYAPNLEGHVIGIQGYTPGELHDKFDMTNGDIMHGSMDWGQLMSFRPMPGYAGYRTPIKDLYMSGAPVDHGGLTGATGLTAARAVLTDMGKDDL